MHGLRVPGVLRDSVHRSATGLLFPAALHVQARADLVVSVIAPGALEGEVARRGIRVVWNEIPLMVVLLGSGPSGSGFVLSGPRT